jgi:Family of unknown function (DUF5317)
MLSSTLLGGSRGELLGLEPRLRDTSAVTLVLLLTLLAVGVGLLLGGRLAGIAHLQLQHREVLALALVVQLTAWALGSISAVGYALGVTVAALAAGLFCVRNLTVPGVPLMTLGLALNFLVVAANGAMPVSLAAAQRAGVDVTELLAGASPRHEVATDRTVLEGLGDIIPVALPGRPEVVSVGDVLLAAGLALLVVTAMRSAPRAKRPAPEQQPQQQPAPPERRDVDAVVKPVGAAIEDYPDPGGHVAVDRATTRDSDSTTSGSYS